MSRSSPARSITARATGRRSRRFWRAARHPVRRIRLVQGDSDQLIAGGGTGGSKSMIADGNAIVRAGEKVVENGRQIAAHVLEAAAADIEFRAGRFVIAGTDRGIGIMDLAARLHAGLQLPPDLPHSLDVKHVSDTPPAGFPNGCHVVEVEIDPETGRTDIVNYVSVDDFGVWSIRCWSRGRCMAASCRASARRSWKRRATTKKASR